MPIFGGFPRGEQRDEGERDCRGDQDREHPVDSGLRRTREIAGTETAVVSIGSIHVGSAPNIIPDFAELTLSVRTFRPEIRERVLAAIERIVTGEVLAAGADRPALIESIHSFPAVVNDAAAVTRLGAALGSIEGTRVIDPGVVTGSEDVGILAQEAGAPCMYWLLGGADPALFAAAHGIEDITRIVASLPSNHSPQFAPAIQPTLELGIRALELAARAWLDAPSA